MTISSNSSRNTYNGNGSTDTFAYTFKILDDDDILVQWKNVDTGAITTKTKTTHYTVTGVGSTGGNVVFTAGNVPDSDTIVILIRDMDFLQEVDYTEYDNFPAETHEGALDKLTMELQQIKEAFDRTFFFDPATADSISFNYTMPDPTGFGGYILRINSDEDSFEYATAIESNQFTFPASSGVLVKNGADTAITREITGTANKITVTNGDGQSGDINITLPATITANVTGNVTGNLTGNVTGNVTGNAGTVTNGVYTTNNLSVMAATTSAQLAGVISDETGSGALVFGTGPSLTSAKIITGLNDTNNNELIKVGATGSAVNEFTITNGATGTGPTFEATGDDSDINITFKNKGNAVYDFRGTADTSTRLRLFEDTDNGTNSVILQAPTSIASDKTIFLPDLDGTVTTDPSNTLAWTSWTPGFTGFSVNPSTSGFKYKKIGNTVFIHIPFATGTSNATTFTITSLPFTAANDTWISMSLAHNNSGNSSSVCVGNISTTTLTLYLAGSATGWTNANAKGASGVFMYETT